MAKISRLDLAQPLTGLEVIPLVQAGATRRTTMSGFANLLIPLLPAALRGDPSGGPGSVGTLNTAVQLAIPAGVDTVTIGGTEVVGDGGAGMVLVRDAAVTAEYVAANPDTSFRDRTGKGFRWATGLLNRGASALVGYYALNGISRTVEARLRDTHIFATDYGARADASSANPTDNVPAFRRAVAAGIAANKPVYLPGAADHYGVNDRTIFSTGLVGSSAGTSIIRALSSAPFADGRAIVEVDKPDVPSERFGIRGAGIRTPARSSKPETMGFAGAGFRFAPGAHGNTARYLNVQFCRNGIVVHNDTGHLNVIECKSSNNWNGFAVTRCTGDVMALGNLFDGNMFASIWLSGDYADATAPGGAYGLTLIRNHLGFSPYGIYQPPGSAQLGLTVFLSLDTRYEECGNKAIWINGINASGMQIFNPGHSATPANDTTYTIRGDADHPVQDVACSYRTLQGGGPMEVIGNGWLVGTTGYHTRIGDTLIMIRDDNGTAGYLVEGGGAERVIDRAQPGGWAAKINVGTLAIGTTATTLAVVNRPARHKSASTITGALVCDYQNSSGGEVRLRFDIDGGSPLFFWVAAGRGLLTIPYSASAGLSATFALTATATGVTLSAIGVAGYLTYQCSYGAATA